MSTPLRVFLVASLAGIFIWSGIRPADRFTWFLEVAPVALGVAALLAMRRRFAFTPLVLVLLWAHAIILLVGGKYTYALNPAFEWLKEALGLARNHYDRLGHFAQGFVPALVARELLIRRAGVRRGPWLFGIVVSVCLAISACYELVEWGVAVATGEASEAFLGTQGDVWDTQWDMFMCLVGALAAQLALGRAHDRALVRCGEEPPGK